VPQPSPKDWECLWQRGAKERLSDTQVRISMLIGDVRGRDVIVLDDEIVNGGSILELASAFARA